MLSSKPINTPTEQSIVDIAKNDVYKRLQAMHAEQEKLLNGIKIKHEESSDESGNAFALRVKEDLKTDNTTLEKFTNSVPFTTYPHITESVKYNKMLPVFSGTFTLFGEDETNICTLAEGKTIPVYDNRLPENLPILGREFWGNSKSTFLSNALMSIHFTLNQTSLQSFPWVSSPVVHAAPLPFDLSFSDPYRFSYQFPLYTAFGFIHNGYAFGGHRNEYDIKDKAFGPEDCSSWVAKITGNPYLFSTRDLLLTYRGLTRNSHVPSTWSETPIANSMMSRYEAVARKDVKPGDIYVHRVFSDSIDPNTCTGQSGHTAIVLEQRGNCVTTLGCNRNMPNLEGFGVQDFHVQSPDRNILTMFLRTKTPLTPLESKPESTPPSYTPLLTL